MNKLLVFLLGTSMCWCLPLAAQEQTAPAPVITNAEYRAQSDVQLTLLFQGLAEGGISRSLRFFGGTGRCEAWYSITEVVTAPLEMEIQSGDRLILDYNCGENRAYVPGETQQLEWAQADGAFARVSLYSGDIDIALGRANTWEIANPANRLAPVSVQTQQ